jgi:hypothetical protein
LSLKVTVVGLLEVFFFVSNAGLGDGNGLGATATFVFCGCGFWLRLPFGLLLLLEQPSIATANTIANAAVITIVAGIPSPKIFPIALPTVVGLFSEFICVMLITSAAFTQPPVRIAASCPKMKLLKAWGLCGVDQMRMVGLRRRPCQARHIKRIDEQLRRNIHVVRQHAILLALLSALGSPQQPTSAKPAGAIGVTIEVATLKKTYAVGEAVRFRALLINSGPAVYVSKEFDHAGGGIAGFYVHVKQLSGNESGSQCGFAGDRLPDRINRSSEQILEEDFLLLPKAGIVGLEDNYPGCEVASPGEYEITATYSAQDLNMSKLPDQDTTGIRVLKGQIQSKPFRFRIVSGARTHR